MSVSATDAPDARKDQERPNSARNSTAEWVTLGISTLLVLGLVGVTSYLYFVAPRDPAAMTVEPHLSDVYESGGRFYLPVTVRNTGGQTAGEVRVRVTVTDGAGRTEGSELQIQFLAGGATHRATVAFGADPRAGEVRAAVTSFLEP